MKKFSFIITITLLALGCELVVDVDIPEFEPSLVVNSNFSPEDTAIWVMVSEDKSILDNSYEFKDVTGAEVEIKENGTSIGELNEVENGTYYLKYQPQAGKEYQIKVTKAGFEKASGKTVIPAESPIFTLEEITSKKGEYGNMVIRLTYAINDPKGADFYEIKLFRQLSYKEGYYDEELDSVIYYTIDSYWEGWYYWNVGADINEFEDYGSYEQTTDDLFDGQNKQFIIEFEDYSDHSSPDNDQIVYRLIVSRLTEEYYRYITAAQLQQDLGGSPFSEPFQVYSNINNGLGIIGSHHSAEKEFYLKNGKWVK